MLNTDDLLNPDIPNELLKESNINYWHDLADYNDDIIKKVKYFSMSILRNEKEETFWKRSQALLRLGLYQEALADAEYCIHSLR